MIGTRTAATPARRLAVAAAAALAATGAAVAAAPPATSAAGVTTRVSSSSAGAAGDQVSEVPSVTADGRYVTFSSAADNLVPGDTDFAEDAFIRDRTTGATERVSVATDGTQPQYGSSRPKASADGRYVVFDSFAPNLVYGDTNGLTDVFLRDRTAHTTVRVSLGAGGTQASGSSYGAAMTPDGRYIVYTSDAPDLVPGDTNGYADVFLLDRQTGTVKLVSMSASGAQGNGVSENPQISSDGRYVAFESQATNLVAGDGNGSTDVFVKDMTTGAVQLVSVTNAGKLFNAGGSTGDGTDMAMSADGRYVSFVGQTTTAVAQLYVRDRVAGTTTLVSTGASGKPGNYATFEGAISPDGHHVVFNTGSSNIVSGAPPYFNTYVRDLVAGTTTLVSLTWTGAPITESTGEAAISNVGVCFQAYAANVVQDTVGRIGQIYFHPV